MTKPMDRERRRTLDDVRNLINSLDTSNLSGAKVRSLIFRELDRLEPSNDLSHRFPPKQDDNY